MARGIEAGRDQALHLAPAEKKGEGTGEAIGVHLGILPVRFAPERLEELNFHFKAMALTRDEVRRIAALARLRLEPEEEEKLTGQLAEVVDYIDRLQAFSGLPEDTAAAGAREMADAILPPLPREAFLANAPRTMDVFVVVPEVKGGDEDA
jgi:aspartyl-tRNA(Asn)/glutamyl-tRNA(Gln) amidotransferase subunit C